MIQPLIENAIHYALEKMIDTCDISIYAKMEAETIQIIVEDNGPGMGAELLNEVRSFTAKTRGQGIGLRNIDERIKLLFGPSYGIQIESEVHAGTRVIVQLPKERGR